MKRYILAALALFSCCLGVAQKMDGVSSSKTYSIQKIIIPPLLNVKEGSVRFQDADGNGRLDANEAAEVSFTVLNNGKGMGLGLKAKTALSGTSTGVSIQRTMDVPNIRPGSSATVKIPLNANSSLATGKITITVTITEPNGLDCNPVVVDFPTLAFRAPKVEIVDGIFSTEGGKVFKKRVPANLTLLVQNTGQGPAKNVKVTISQPKNVLPLTETFFDAGSLAPGDSKKLHYGFIVNAKYSGEQVLFNTVISESFGRYGSDREFSISLNQTLAKATVSFQGETYKEVDIERVSLSADVDRDIPVNINVKEHRYALVIGNEDYVSSQTGLRTEANVEFARNDAQVFKQYLVKTLGFREKHVFLHMDATRGMMNREINKLTELAGLHDDAEIVFYYAGHGLPDQDTKIPYLVPVDVTAANLQADGIPLNELYQKLSATNAKKVTVFLDACFSGGGRDQGLLAARSVKIKPKREAISGNMVVFAASSGEEVSLPYRSRQHGLFTYFLLKKLQETEGKATYGDISQYLTKEVQNSSLLENGMKQTPTVNVSVTVRDSWKSWSFR